MDLSPLENAPAAIQLHVAAVSLAIVCVIPILLLKKGTRLHKTLGRVWVLAMIVTALSSFAISTINQINGLSLIHLISIYVLIGLYRATKAIRGGDVNAHKSAMIGIIIGGLGIAGGLTFLPDRIMYLVVFGS